MREEDRREFLAWYESHYPICDSKRVLESYSQDDVTVLRQARKRFRLELMQIGKLQIFLKSIIIASAFNKILRKIFLHPVTIGLIPIGGFTCNCNYSKKALIWLLDMEQIDGVKILHDRNGREFKVPELPHFNVNGYCLETRTIYEFSGCQWHANTCQLFRDVINLNGDTFAEQYERKMHRLEQMTWAGYLVKLQLECEFDGEVRSEVLANPLVQESPLLTDDTLYGGRKEAMRLQNKERENEVIKYVDVMSLYTYIYNYFKFPVGHAIIHVGDACKDIESCLCMDALIKC